MTDQPTALIETKRILVALDTSARGRAALQVAVRLALNSSAEIQGLFVEDEDLMRLASLPFACAVDVTSAVPRPLQSASMERDLRLAAGEAQQAFTKALQQLNLRWTFRIVRGTVTQASLAAAGDVDLLVIGQQGRSSPTMTGNYLPHRPSPERPVVAVFDGSPSAFRTLELARSLIEPNAPALTVLVLDGDSEDRSQRCMAWLQERGIRAEVNEVLRPSSQPIVDYVRKYPAGMLLINRDSGFISAAQICRLVNEFDCPLILC
jgi:nucleotide-binding universal stress UspA family protein